MTATTVRVDYNLLRQVARLLRLSWLMSLKGFTRAGTRRKIVMALLALVGVGVVAGIFLASWGLLALLQQPEVRSALDLTTFVAGFPAIILTLAFVLTLTFSFGVLLQGLYLSGDMEFLLSAPVPIRAVFAAKLLQAILPNFGLMSLFALPALWGLGAAVGYNLLYYPLVVLLLAAVVLAAAGLASLFVIAAARVLPARTVAEVLGLIGGVIAITLSQAGQFSRAFELEQTQVQQGLRWLSFLNSPWSPFAWAGRGITDFATGAWATGLVLSLLTLGACGAVFVAALATAERLYFTGWARLTVAGQRKRASHRRLTPRVPWLSSLAHFAPSSVRGIMIKDALVLRRDLRSLSQLVGPLILTIIYAVLFLRSGGEPPAGRGEAPPWFMQTLRVIFVYGNVGLALFIGWTLLSRLALMSFSQESRYYWLIKAAPVSPARILVSKFLVAYLPTLALGWLFLVAISILHAASAGSLLFGLLVVAFCLAGGAGLYLSFGVLGANLAWTDPRHMISGYASCAGALVSGGYMLVSLGLFFIPPIALVLLGEPELPGQLIGLGLGGLLGVTCAAVPMVVLRGRVERLGEA